MKEKRLKAEGVKRLPVGSYVERRKEDGSKKIGYIVVRSGKKKMLSVVGMHEMTISIEEREGWYFICPERS